MANVGSMYATIGVRLRGIEAAQKRMMQMLNTVSSASDRTSAKLNKVGESANRINKQAEKIKPIHIEPVVDSKPAMTELDKVTSHIFRSAQRWRTIGYLTSIVITAPIIAAGKAAIDTASDFNFSMAKIRGLVGLSAESVAKLREEILTLAPAVAQTPKELAEGAYFVTSAGFKDAAEAMKIVETAAKLSTAGMGETADIAKLLVFSMNAYKKSGLTAARAADVFTAAVREGAIEADGFASAMQQVLPISSALGVKIEEVAGSMAAMSLQGASAQNAAVYLKGILNAILKIKPNNAAGKQLKEFGITADDLMNKLREPGGLMKTLILLQDLANKRGGAPFLKDIFRDIRAMTGDLSLMGENFQYNQYVMEKVANAGGDVQFAYKSVDEQIKVLKDRIKATSDVIKIQFGEVLANDILPLIEGLINKVKKITEWFTSLDKGTQKTITHLLGIVALIGPFSLLMSVIRYGWGGAWSFFGKQAIWVRSIIKGLNGDLIAMGNAAAANKSLTSLFKMLSTKSIKAGGWGALFKDLAKGAVSFGRTAGPAAIVATAVGAGAIAFFRYAKNLKEAVQQNELFNKTMVGVNEQTKKFNELNKEDIGAMTLDQMMQNREKARQIWTESYQLYTQYQKNLQNPLQSKGTNKKLMEEQAGHIAFAKRMYEDLTTAMTDMQMQLVREKQAQEQLKLDEQRKKQQEYNEELETTYKKIYDEVKAIDEKAKVYEKLNKPFDVAKEKAEALLKGIETLTGTEFGLKFDDKKIQQLIISLRELNYDFSETGKASKKFVDDLNSDLGSIKMKKGLLGNMYDADSATLELYKKGLDDYISILTSVDPITGVILTPTQEQLNILDNLIKKTELYTRVVENNVNRDTLSLLQAEADAYGSIAGKLEVVNYELQAQQKYLKDLLKEREKGNMGISDEKIKKLISNIRELKGEQVDLQSALQTQYFEDMNKSMGTNATYAQVLEGRISTLQEKLKYLSEEGKGATAVFKIMSKELWNLQAAQSAVGILSDSFNTFFDSMIEGGQNMNEILAGIFKNLLKQIFAVLAQMLALRIVFAILGGGSLKGMSKINTSNIKVPQLAPSIPSNLAGPPTFAKGGIVPKGFPNDSYPALLSSGETVIPKGLKLDTFRLPVDKENGGEVVFKIEGDTLVGILKKKGKKSSIY